MNERYYVFYKWAYGGELRAEVYDDQESMLARVKQAKEPDSPYRDFAVIYGTSLDFEPVEVVMAYRIKHSE